MAAEQERRQNRRVFAAANAGKAADYSMIPRPDHPHENKCKDQCFAHAQTNCGRYGHNNESCKESPKCVLHECPVCKTGQPLIVMECFEYMCGQCAPDFWQHVRKGTPFKGPSPARKRKAPGYRDDVMWRQFLEAASESDACELLIKNGYAHRTIARCMKDWNLTRQFQAEPPLPPPQNWVLFGPAATGKSYACRAFASTNGLSCSIWYPGHFGDRGAIDIAFGGDMEPEDLEAILDGTSARLYIKPEWVFITCQGHPSTWWPRRPEASNRVLAKIQKLTECSVDPAIADGTDPRRYIQTDLELPLVVQKKELCVK